MTRLQSSSWLRPVSCAALCLAAACVSLCVCVAAGQAPAAPQAPPPSPSRWRSPERERPPLPLPAEAGAAGHAWMFGGSGGGARGAARVVFVSSEFAGLVPNGGIGTFYSALAESLVAAGHDVTLLYTQGLVSHAAGKDFEHWRAHYAARGLALVPLPPYRPPGASYHAGTSYQVMDWLSRRTAAGAAFDVAHFPDWQGHGYFSALARRMFTPGLRRTRVVVMVHGPLAWARASNAQRLDTLEDLESDFLEQNTVRLAETLVSPSRYLLRWMERDAGWELPPPHRVFVQPYTMPRAAREAVEAARRRAAAPSPHAPHVFPTDTNPSSVAPVPTPLPAGWGPSRAVSEGELAPRRTVREVVFFGRLEVRKGIALFCDAVDALVAGGLLGAGGALGGAEGGADNVGGVRVTFLGSDRNWVEPGVDGGAYARRRAAAWAKSEGDTQGGGSEGGRTPLAAPAEVVTGLDTAGALDYLLARGAGRFAVLPSLVENSPLSILELLGAGVPFLASTAGGIPELIHADDQLGVLFPAETGALVGKLREALVAGVPRARPARNLERVERRWVGWHEAHAGFGNAEAGDAAGTGGIRIRATATAQGGDDAWGQRRRQKLEEAAEAGVEDVAALTATTTMAGIGATAGAAAGAAVEDMRAAAADRLTVIVAARDASGAALRMTLLSALAMSPPPAAVVVTVASEISMAVDDSEAMPRALAVLLPPEQLHRVRWTSTPGATLAEARNAAAAIARDIAEETGGGGPLLIADAGTFLEPHAGAALAAALSTAAADVVTSLLHFYGPGDSMPRDGADRHALPDTQRRFHIFLGAALSVGAFRNCFGGAVYMLRDASLLQREHQHQHQPPPHTPPRASAGVGPAAAGSGSRPPVAVGGWAWDLTEGYEHWEWLARASLAGARVELYPEAVAWSPPTPGAHRTARVDAAAAAAARPLLARLPNEAQRVAVATAAALGGVESIRPLARPPPRVD